MNKQENIFRRKQKSYLWVRVFTAVLVTIVVTLSVFPIVVAYGLESWFKEQGIDKAIVEDVDFNIFTGIVALSGVSLIEANEQQFKLHNAQVEFSLWPIFSNRFVVNQVLLRDITLSAGQKEDGQLIIAGLPIPTTQGDASQDQTTADKPWEFAIQKADISGFNIQVTTPQTESVLQIDSFKLENLYSWKLIPATAHLSAKLNDDPIELTAEMHPFVPTPQYSGTLKINQLSLLPYAKFAESHLQELSGNFTSDINFKIEISDSAISYKHQGSVQLANLTVKNQNFESSNDAIKFDGDVQLNLDRRADTQSIQIEGDLESNAHQTIINQFQADYTNLKWQGDVSYQTKTDGEPPAIKTSGQLQANGLQVNPVDRPLKYAVLEAININKYEIKSLDDITLNDIVINNSTVGIVPPEEVTEEPAKALLQSRLISLNSIKVKDLNKVNIGVLNVNGLTANLIRQPQNKFYVISNIFPPQESIEKNQATVQKSNADDKPQKVTVTIDQLRIRDSSKVNFVDTGLAQVFKETLYIDELVVKNINTANPENLSSITLKAKAGEFTGINASGNAKLFAENMQLDLQAKVTQLELPPLSPYTEDTLGFDFHSGRLNADVGVKIADNQMNGEIKLLIRKLELEPSDPDKMDSLTSSLGMSMDSALVLLTDKNNNIRLKIPIEGDLTDPKFNINHAINTAIGKSMKSASVAYLAYAFQPYGSAIILVQLADKARSHVSLDPAIFAAGDVGIQLETGDYLEVVAKVMKEREQLHLRLCGYGTESDRQAIYSKEKSEANQQSTKEAVKELPDKSAVSVTDETLEQLAKDRSKTIRSYLVERHGINQDRLFICGPQIDKGENTKPRVEILI